MSFVVKLAHLTQTDHMRRAKNTATIQLLTISISHYVEMARWCLQLCGLKYEEHGYGPVQHVLPVLSARIDRNTKKRYIGTSSATESANESERSEKKKTPHI